MTCLQIAAFWGSTPQQGVQGSSWAFALQNTDTMARRQEVVRWLTHIRPHREGAADVSPQQATMFFPPLACLPKDRARIAIKFRKLSQASPVGWPVASFGSHPDRAHAPQISPGRDKPGHDPDAIRKHFSAQAGPRALC